MADKKMFLDFSGLSQYDELIKAYIDSQNELDQGGVEKVVADLAEANIKITAVETQAAENKAAIEVLNGDSEGSVSKQVSDAIAELVGSAPETFDTLKEIADWIENDTNATAEIVERITKNESDVTNLKNADVELKAYIDAQDKNYYDSINSIEEVRIKALFLKTVNIEEGQTINDVLTTLTSDQKLVLDSDAVVTDDITVPENVYIDANGATLSGNITIPESSVIDNAIFTGKVTIG